MSKKIQHWPIGLNQKASTFLLVFSLLMACNKKQEMQKAQTIDEVPIMKLENEVPDSLKKSDTLRVDSSKSASIK